MLCRFLLVVTLIHSASARISCKDLDGTSVDWFVIYKLPQGIKNGNKGKEFIYADSNNPEWTLARKTIEDERAPVGATMGQVYRNDPTTFSAAWSDDGPNARAEGYRAHSKGVLLFDYSTGFWLSHSVPNFPPLRAWSYPQSGVRFAQVFMCLTVSTDILGEIADQLRLMQATPFAHNLPERFATRFPNLRSVIDKKPIPKTSTIFKAVKRFITNGGTPFVSVAKHKKFEKDLWVDIVATESGANLAVQSWLNGGADDLHSSCTPRAKVFDVQSIKVLGTSFRSSMDHSKWGVSDNANIPIACVGDLNRQKSQLQRGGGALCIQHPRLWKTFYDSVENIEQCTKGDIRLLNEYSLLLGLSIVLACLYANTRR